MRVTFIPHGQSTGNAGVRSFDLSKIGLTAIGHQQAARLASSWDVAPTLIALSPYLRTHLTAQPTIDRFPLVPVEVLPMEEFTYLEPSRWNGTSRLERLPYIESHWSTADPAYQDGPDAESFDDLLRRVWLTFECLQKLPAESIVYAFSHGQFMQAVRMSLGNPAATSAELMARFWSFYPEHPILNTDRLDMQYGDQRWSCEVA